MERSEVASGLSCWLPHALTFALASLVFQLAFLISPYWRLAPTTGSRLGLAALTTLVGVAWAYLATGSLEFRLPISDLVALLTVLGAMLVLNLLALMSVVPWRGDEDFHLPVVQNLILLIGRLGIRATLLLMVLLFYCFFAYRSARVTSTLVVATLGLLLWDRFAVVARATTMQVRNHDYVSAAWCAGASMPHILIKEILPNIASHLAVVATLEMALAILLEAALSFLGLGVPPPLPSWGLMIAEGKDYMFFSPWVIMIPGVALAVLVLGINLVGDGLRNLLGAERLR